jgi:hypothetical protein
MSKAKENNVQLDEKSKEMKRVIDDMRPMTEAAMSERQRLAAQGMQNTRMCPVPGMKNRWATNETHWIMPKPKPTFWQQTKLLFVKHTAKLPGCAEPNDRRE